MSETCFARSRPCGEDGERESFSATFPYKSSRFKINKYSLHIQGMALSIRIADLKKKKKKIVPCS
jgi:hypothetical protein